MNKTIASIALLVAVAATIPGRAATVSVAIVGFQYTPSGWLTATPYGLGEEGTVETPAGTPHDAPTVHRGDTLAFSNMDPVPHTVSKDSGPQGGNWSFLDIDGGESANLQITASFPAGEYVYKCAYHAGMRGAFTVVA